MKPEIEKAIIDLLPEILEAAKNIFGNDYEDHSQEIILSTLQRDEDFIQGLIDIDQLKYYMFKSLWFRKMNMVRDARNKRNNIENYSNDYVAFHSPSATYSLSDVKAVQDSIKSLSYMEQLLIKYYLENDCNATKLANEIRLNTDGVGIPKSMVWRMIREIKKKIREKVNENNSSNS